MTSGGVDSRTLALVLFSAFVTVSLLLCGLAATDQDEAEQFYTGNASLGPLQNGLAIAGDYISAATVLSTTGAIALAGYDGILFACATVLSLALLMLVLAQPLRGPGRYTLGDVLAERLRERPVRIAMGTATLIILMPLLLVQLSAAGKVMVWMLGLPDGAQTGCTVGTGALMVCYSAIGGMRGTGLVQILKTVVVVAAVVLLSALVLGRFGWNPVTLFDAASSGSGHGADYGRPGLQFGDSTAGRLDLIGFQLTLVLGAACMPHVTMRLYAVRSARSVRRAMSWAVGAVAVLCAGVVVIGLGAAALVGARTIHTADPAGGTSLMLLTGALGPGQGGDGGTGHGLLFAFVACAVFATTLAAVAGITLAAASALAHDLLARLTLRGRVSTRREVLHARCAVVALGVLAVLLSVLVQDRNPQVLVSFTFSAAASALLPVLLYTLFWPRFTTTGMRCTLYGTLLLVAALMALSPAVSGTPIALFPERDFHLYPLQTPGLITIPAGFALGWLGSVAGGPGRHRPLSRRAAAQRSGAESGTPS